MGAGCAPKCLSGSAAATLNVAQLCVVMEMRSPKAHGLVVWWEEMATIEANRYRCVTKTVKLRIAGAAGLRLPYSCKQCMLEAVR